MKALRVMFRLGLLIGFGVTMLGVPNAAQTTSPKKTQPSPPGLRKLTGDDEKRAKHLDEQIDKATKADRWDEAIARAEELLDLRMKAQGPKHFETIDADWQLKTLRHVAQMAADERVAYRSTIRFREDVDALVGKVRYTEAQPLFEKLLEINRRLFTDEHPKTAEKLQQRGCCAQRPGEVRRGPAAL
ncbi:MAG: tetratricopeptide repeat protein [Isosphaeraceae bacterium]